MDPLSILVGAVVGALVVTAGILFVPVPPQIASDVEVRQAAEDARYLGVGVLRRREDGVLEAIDPKSLEVITVGGEVAYVLPAMHR